MYRSNRILPAVVIPILAVVAILGYLIGNHHARASAGAEEAAAGAGGRRVASAATVLFEYPSTWTQARVAPLVPGLAIDVPFVLAPGGNSARAGLVSGQLPGGEPSPLPRRFLSLLSGVPNTEVVSLTNAQAYRYSQLHVAGLTTQVDLYVIPNLGARSTVVACYAAAGYGAYLHECEEIVSKLTLVGQAAAVLSPNTTYAGEIGHLFAKLDKEREALRGEIHAAGSFAAAAAPAKELGDRFLEVANALHGLEPPLAAVAAQTALAAAVLQSGNAYTALAAAAASEGVDAYRAAQREVAAGEAAIDAALESYSLLGYSPS